MGVVYTLIAVIMVLFRSVWSVPTQTVGATACSEPLWCVAKPGATESELQDAIYYVCTTIGVECSPICQGGLCFQPQTLYNHASFVMNRYYQSRGCHTWDCYFSGIGLFAAGDPSHGSCNYDHA